ncbi:MAG TPA: hypothetical protein VG713_09065 [Pirellulales bacterium]|nr:hypothetical protein [Pirellulales bacterium]
MLPNQAGNANGRVDASHRGNYWRFTAGKLIPLNPIEVAVYQDGTDDEPALERLGYLCGDAWAELTEGVKIWERVDGRIERAELDQWVIEFCPSAHGVYTIAVATLPDLVGLMQQLAPFSIASMVAELEYELRREVRSLLERAA